MNIEKIEINGHPNYKEKTIDVIDKANKWFETKKKLIYKGFDKPSFIEGYSQCIKDISQTAEKELPTWDDVRKAMILARKNQQFPFSFPKSDEEIIEQLKQSKNDKKTN